MSARTNNLAYHLHMRLPADEKAAQALWEHLRDLSLLCTSAGWSVDITVTITKEPTDG